MSLYSRDCVKPALLVVKTLYRAGFNLRQNENVPVETDQGLTGDFPEPTFFFPTRKNTSVIPW